MRTTFLGDTHGDWTPVYEATNKNKNGLVIHVGDVGLGFPEIINVHTGKPFASDPKELPNNFKFNRGNHDNPLTCRSYPNYLGDYGFDEKLGLFYISGAWSIDANYRRPGLDWWEDEELSTQDLMDAISLYERIKPDVVVSHTVPKCICKLLTQEYHGSRTENALENMFEIHRPRYWIFGHWHIGWQLRVLGTKFICCSINETFDLELPLKKI